MRIAFLKACAALVFAAATFSATGLPAQQPDPANRALAHDIFAQLIEINTTDSVGSTTTAARAMQQRLLDAGFPAADMQLLGPNDRKGNLVVRYRGTGAKKPVLIIGHLDVVEARREDWTTDPFKFVEKDGFYYGRGTQDMKEDDALFVANFIRLWKEGYKPDRDIILALTADEEGGKSNGVAWLLKNHRNLIDAAFVINPDSGGIDLSHGKPLLVAVEATEKVYADYQLMVTNPGGHSSLPRPDNAIYHLADALVRLQQYSFPFELNPVTRTYFARLSSRTSGQTAADMQAILKPLPDPEAIQRLSRDPLYNSTMRTTCVATRLNAGHANNALPQTAQANVNCRIFPGHSPEQIRKQLIGVFADDKVTVKYVSDAGEAFDTAPERTVIAPPPPLPEVFDPLERIAAEFWPGAPVVPIMETGASDSIYIADAGIPSYGFSAVALESGDMRAHGKDERIPVNSYYQAVEFYYRYLKAISGGK
ncbi:MAG TPA: M20/M25/M40 family metallo-hydrolase [Acidisarcina sp.]|nr:M20/M25/M40 family metallo-hydrolase [Acidisarcina sp.]